MPPMRLWTTERLRDDLEGLDRVLIEWVEELGEPGHSQFDESRIAKRLRSIERRRQILMARGEPVRDTILPPEFPMAEFRAKVEPQKLESALDGAFANIWDFADPPGGASFGSGHEGSVARQVSARALGQVRGELGGRSLMDRFGGAMVLVPVLLVGGLIVLLFGVVLRRSAD